MFWFFQRTFSTSGQTWLRNKKSCASVVLCDSKVTFLWEEEDAIFHSFHYCALFIHSVAKSKKSRRISLLFIKLFSFSLYNCFQNCVKFILYEVSKFNVLLCFGYTWCCTVKEMSSNFFVKEISANIGCALHCLRVFLAPILL